MDHLDQELMLSLTKDARASATDLAQNLGVSRGTVQNRFDKLLHTKVIERFTVELGNAEQDHQVSAFTLIKLTADDGRATQAALRRVSAVTGIHSLSGNFDMVVEIRVASLMALDAVLDQIRDLPHVADTQSHIRLASVG